MAECRLAEEMVEREGEGSCVTEITWLACPLLNGEGCHHGGFSTGCSLYAIQSRAVLAETLFFEIVGRIDHALNLLLRFQAISGRYGLLTEAQHVLRGDGKTEAAALSLRGEEERG